MEPEFDVIREIATMGASLSRNKHIRMHDSRECAGSEALRTLVWLHRHERVVRTIFAWSRRNHSFDRDLPQHSKNYAIMSD